MLNIQQTFYKHVPKFIIGGNKIGKKKITIFNDPLKKQGKTTSSETNHSNCGGKKHFLMSNKLVTYLS